MQVRTIMWGPTVGPIWGWEQGGGKTEQDEMDAPNIQICIHTRHTQIKI